ncbi:DsrC like protein [Neomoorella glycerini]|uniref:DsrC like protein n=1 Tax=Neomoorella glycerini TaxID=55779 RepID=A0A6I5ZLI4_9FIRM|nr:TusE/DsrC/DsvC family sulfur relay protein [Moorella glycerini]QGP90730.1 DsrC like protein [Moorella glycerini]
MLPPDDKKREITTRARQRGIILNEDHWKLIAISYEYYDQHRTICTLRNLIKLSGLDKKQIYKLFPGNPIGEISQITGLPMPKEC